MIGYKLTTQALTTHDGFQWKVGKAVTATGEGNAPCTDGVLHYYESPLHAVLFNPIHASIENPILWEIECSEQLGTDGLKCWCKSQTLLRQVELPVITTDERIEFSIRCAKAVCTGVQFNEWADKWLSGQDRSGDLAATASRSAESRGWVAAMAASRSAAMAAARSEAWAAEAASEEIINKAIKETFKGDIKCLTLR